MSAVSWLMGVQGGIGFVMMRRGGKVGHYTFV